MEKFVSSLITVEKSIQIVTLVGVVIFLGYLGFTSYQTNRTFSVPSISPTIQK